jgi:hypothetical protein
MRLLKLSTLIGLAVVALSGIMISTAAAAEIEYLGNIPNTFTMQPTAEGEKIHFGFLNNTFSLLCMTTEGSGEVTGTKKMTFDQLILGCSIEVFGTRRNCTGLNDTVPGSILIKGEGLLGWTSNKAGELVIPIVALKIEEAHFECLGLVLVKGCIVAELLNPNELVTTTSIHLRAPTLGDQEFTKFSHKKGEAHKECVLLGSISFNAEQKFEMMSLEFLPKLTFPKVILLMA